MSHKIIPALFALYLSSASAHAAPLPAPVQALLQQIKGEWVVLDQNSLSIRLSLKADGSGELANYEGTSPIRWRLDAGSIRITLLNPTTSSWVEYENDQEIKVVSALQTLSLDYKKLEGFGTIIWKMTSQGQTTYPDHPERTPQDVTTVSENTRLVAGRQFKKFAPQEGQTLALALPNYSYTEQGLETQGSVAILGRLDAANVMTVLRGQDVVSSLYWTIDKGQLRLSDGKGYTVSYKLYKGDNISGQLLADVQTSDRTSIADYEVVYSNESIRAEGFRADSPLFQGCWTAFHDQTSYCFKPDRHFSFTTKDAEFGSYTTHGIWRLEEGRIIVDRFRELNGAPLDDAAALLACEKELADASDLEKSCELHQTRSYELINQNADSIGVYRILKQSNFTSRDTHVFKREF